ncbi:hypothetical protein O1611_g251 [Lasiodiplodia mahajangana]|uniref:Uncharacterized protein n=1 Tax=Lasiodiplodia mahajangana TaxID=1108764 RepID=A0ACC2K0Q6_9PEZI|nr:hypothetical protein O1611_g251 [Lasiodiplodia mahajangana]
MSSRHSAPNNALALGSKESRQSLRQVVEEQAGQKRGSNQYMNNGGKEDVQPKRPKIIDDCSPDPTVEDLLGIVSLPTLKKICAEVLQDKTASARLSEELLSRTQDILATARAEAIKERNAIISTANSKIRGIIDTAYMENKHMCNCDEWPSALFPLLRRIKDLNNRGSVAGVPERAWEALIKVAALCIYDWDGSGLKLYGSGEEDCDYFHDEVDKVMLLICKAQKQNGKVEWLKGGRQEEIRNLQERAEGEGGPCTYRYQDTLKFLEQP